MSIALQDSAIGASRPPERRYFAVLMDAVLVTEPLDAAAGSLLIGAFIEEIAPRYPGWKPDIGPSARPEEFVPPLGRFLIAYSGKRPVACGGVKCLDDTTGEVKRLYVVPDARGRGVGRRLLRALEDAAVEFGRRRVRLDTGDQQPDALGLFRAAGYREIPDYNANPCASYWFEKPLA
jgi:GNAT superfamily N-acetyltransferase